MVMKIEVVGTTNNLKNAKEMTEYCYKMGRLCYTEKSWDELLKEPIKEKLMQGMINSGHHSIFEHANISFYFEGLPKIIAMVFNN
ncbi:MAG: FAD-dependent thymidylate synthase, partial [Nanoarchaeota archaeon]